MQTHLLHIIHDVLDKSGIDQRIKLCAAWYEERAAKDLDMISELCKYLNDSELTATAEGYAIVISDIAQNLKRWLTDNEKKIVNPQNATQDAKSTEDHADIGAGH